MKNSPVVEDEGCARCHIHHFLGMPLVPLVLDINHSHQTCMTDLGRLFYCLCIAYVGGFLGYLCFTDLGRLLDCPCIGDGGGFLGFLSVLSTGVMPCKKQRLGNRFCLMVIILFVGFENE